MNTEKFKHIAQAIAQRYQRVEDYFTNGSFGVKFYPILMYPCVRHSHTAIIKLLAVLSVFLGLDFFFAELIAILFSNDSLASYANHTIYSLSLPLNTVIEDRVFDFSPLYYVISASFLLQGYLFWIVYLFAVMRTTQGVRLIAGALAIAFSMGMAMIYSAQGGQFTLGGLQNLGVSITFLLGNLLMILTGLTVKSPKLKFFKGFSLTAGVLGAAAVSITLVEPTEYLPLLERASLYATLAWQVAAGFAILKQVNK